MSATSAPPPVRRQHLEAGQVVPGVDATQGSLLCRRGHDQAHRGAQSPPRMPASAAVTRSGRSGWPGRWCPSAWSVTARINTCPPCPPRARAPLARWRDEPLRHGCLGPGRFGRWRDEPLRHGCLGPGRFGNRNGALGRPTCTNQHSPDRSSSSIRTNTSTTSAVVSNGTSIECSRVRIPLSRQRGVGEARAERVDADAVLGEQPRAE